VAGFLNSRFRRALQPPEQVIGWMDIREGMQVVELGPGPGTYTVEASRRVGSSGHITAVDLQPGMIARLDATLRTAGVTNVTPRVASAYELPLPDGSVDRAFMVTVLAEIPDPVRALREIRRVLRPDGRLAVGEFLPDPDYPLRATVIGWGQAAGFELVGSYGGLMHYVLVFRPVA
jgi:ubiquinone/menaquinone biosynthesis C-methylase UbiE